ncbi:MAG TPA: hypothetical protein P5210_02415, partial [Draconibacterium sp.]|nr:hypothetical protein [Draconibacterium sp.]
KTTPTLNSSQYGLVGGIRINSLSVEQGGKIAIFGKLWFSALACEVLPMFAMWVVSFFFCGRKKNQNKFIQICYLQYVLFNFRF